VHGLAEALTTSDIQSHGREQWLLIWLLHFVDFVVNFSLDVNRMVFSICRCLAKLVAIHFLCILNPEIMVKRCARDNILQTHLLEQVRQFSHAFGFPPYFTCCPDSRIARLDDRTLFVILTTTFGCLPLFFYLMKMLSIYNHTPEVLMVQWMSQESSNSICLPQMLGTILP